jgi:phosphoribosylglycinamide formyltransferase-1
MNIGILASGKGSTLQAVINAVRSKEIIGQVQVVICNKEDAQALHIAKKAGITTCCISEKTHPAPEDRDAAMLDALTLNNVELVLLAGYLKKVGPVTLRGYQGRIINTHPALLPKFGGKGMYGINVHRAVLAAGETESGVSVHIIDGEYDTGPVIAQCRVPVKPKDTPETLSERVHKRELRFVVETLSDIASGKLRL